MKFAWALILGILILISNINPVFAVDLNDGEKVFSITCAGCHINGGNIVRRGKNLKLKTLQKNKIDNMESIINLVTNGKNNMSSYQDKLTKEQIENVAAYVLKQAENNWK
jgi:cytochrome c6